MNKIKTIVDLYLRRNGYEADLISNIIELTRPECLELAAEIIDNDPQVLLSLIEDIVYIPDGNI